MADMHQESGHHVNYRYVLEYARRISSETGGAKILDYGCGAGETVIAGRQEGLEIFGAEVFSYAAGSDRRAVEASGLLGATIREIKDGRLDFPDGYFDFVFTNQVLEHVVDLDQVVAEIARVLKPGAVSLHLFPSRDVWREGHCGIPFLHRFPKTSRLRYPYALFLRTIGLGKYKRVDHRGWVGRVLNFQDEYCTYRPRKVIFATFRKYFDFTLIEDDYIRFRLGGTRLRYLAPLVHWPLVRPLAKEAFRKLGGLVILAKKLDSSP